MAKTESFCLSDNIASVRETNLPDQFLKEWLRADVAEVRRGEDEEQQTVPVLKAFPQVVFDWEIWGQTNDRSGGKLLKNSNNHASGPVIISYSSGSSRVRFATS